MKRNILLFLVIISITNLNAQPSIQWQKCFGGTTGDWGISIQQTLDSGYIVAGYTTSNDSDVTGLHGNDDFWILKLNSGGTIQWKQCLGGSSYDEPYSILQTSDSGYVIAGFSASNDFDVTGNHGNDDFWVVKLNNLGIMQWQKSIGGSTIDAASSIQQTSDGGYIVAGSSDSNDGDVSGNHGANDFWLAKLDGSGNIQWQKCLGGSSDDIANSIQLTNDGGYIVAGSSMSNNGDVTGNHGNWDYWIVKLDNAANIQWQKCFGGTGQDIAYSIQQNIDSSYVVAGFTKSNNGDVSGFHGSVTQPDYWVIKINYLGNLQWQKCLGGTSDDKAYFIQQTTDSGCVVAGYTYSNGGDVTGYHGNRDYWIVKLSGIGNIQWQKCLGGTNEDWAKSICQTNDDGYVITGFSASTNGDVTNNNGTNDYWIVKLFPFTIGIEEHNFTEFRIFPNPTSDQFFIDANTTDKLNVNLYDVNGRHVFSKSVNNKSNIDVTNLNEGVYNLTVKTADRIINKKLVILR